MIILLLILTNLYTVWLALKQGRAAARLLVVEFYRGYYTARLHLQPGRPNFCRVVTWIAQKDETHRLEIPGWRWPIKAYKPKS